MSYYADKLLDMGVSTPVIYLKDKEIYFTVNLKKVKNGKFKINGVKNVITYDFVNQILPILYNIYVSNNSTDISKYNDEISIITEEFLFKNIIDIK